MDEKFRTKVRLGDNRTSEVLRKGTQQIDTKEANKDNQGTYYVANLNQN